MSLRELRDVAGRAIALLATGLVVLVLGVVVVVPKLGGATPYTVLTGSMRPTMPPGTLVVVKPVKPEQIRVGDVITFQIKSGDPAVATHRVVGVGVTMGGDYLLKTKGDANNAADPTTVRPEQIRGKRWYSVPYLAWPTLKVGALGTHKALGLAKEKKARFVLASTSEVYGDPLEHPQKETYWGNVNPVGPRGVYDEAKRFAEAMTMAYHRYHAVDAKIVRIFNTYGPRMRINDGRSVPAFMSQALPRLQVSTIPGGSAPPPPQSSGDAISDLLAAVGIGGGKTDGEGGPAPQPQQPAPASAAPPPRDPSDLY